MKSRTVWAFAAVGILWGSAWIPSSVVLREMPGLRAGAVRFAIAAIFATSLALIAWLQNRVATPRTPALLRNSLVLGLTALALPYALMAYVAGQVSSGTVAVLFAFVPLAALLLNREAISAAIPTIVIGIGGVTFLVAQGLSLSVSQLKGAVLTGCAVLLAAFSLNYAKTRLRRSDLLVSVSVQFASAAVFLGLFSAFVEHEKPVVWNGDALLSLLILGAVISGLSLPLMYWLLFELESWQVASLQWSATLIAVAEAAWLLRARPSMDMWAGAALIVGATLWLLLGTGLREPEAVTLQITNHTPEAPAASESEVGSK